MKRRTFLMAATLTAGLFASGATLAEELKMLRFGIISTESTQNLRSMWDPFLADMERKLGMPVKAYFAPDYAGIIEGMRFDKVDVAWYGNKSAMEAVDRAGAEIFAQTVDVNGNPGYWSVLITQKDNDQLNSVDDVLENAADLSFGNGDPNSTSGYLVPGYYVFAQNGVDVKKAFKRVLNANHETNALAVANGQVDVATNNTENMARMELNFPEKYKDVKVIWKSPLIPSDPIAWRKNLSDTDKRKIRDFFMDYGVEGMDKERELEVLAGLQWAPFRTSSDDQLLPIRQLALFKDRAKVENDERFSAAEKAEKLKTIDAELTRLQQRLAALESRQ
jgi:phosphonate transport system substrate-binding protein